ncbi:hypothetical protein BD408DRAFT_456943 [Parasitella parasitica]|nr:hypothetical protein BD408DRAFT_456943 [Parasitella parasitica]
MNPKTYATQQWNEFLNQEIPIAIKIKKSLEKYNYNSSWFIQVKIKALKNIKHAQEQQRSQYNKKTRKLVKFKIGNLVLRKNHKMMAFPKERWIAPWRILEVTNQEGTAYKIAKVEDPKVMSTVNIVDLRLLARKGE